MFERTKIVDYEGYCKKCKWYDKGENEDPCWDCLTNSVNYNTHKPTKYEEATKG